MRQGGESGFLGPRSRSTAGAHRPLLYRRNTQSQCACQARHARKECAFRKASDDDKVTWLCLCGRWASVKRRVNRRSDAEDASMDNWDWSGHRTPQYPASKKSDTVVFSVCRSSSRAHKKTCEDGDLEATQDISE
jgi:hypothetical protein